MHAALYRLAPIQLTNFIAEKDVTKVMRMKRNSLLASLAAMALLTAGVNLSQAATPKGETFVIGTDTPLAAVASFSVQIASIDAVDSSTGASESLLSSPATIDFARFNGLQTLIDINSIPVGKYDEIVVTIGPNPRLGYLLTSAGNPPSIQYITPTLTTYKITKHLEPPLVVSQSEPVGIRMDFDLHRSIQVVNGQINGTVDPKFQINVVGPNAPGAFIDEFDTGVLTVDAKNQSFMVQGPHGRTWTIDTTNETEWDGGATLGELNTSTIVQISGTLARSTSTITADEITILSQNGFYAGGLNTFVTPSSGAAGSFDLYVRGLLPSTTGLTLGEIATVDVSSTDKYYIRWNRHRLPEALSTLVFNAGGLLPGQSIGVGGDATGAANPDGVTVNRVTLRDWGYVGTVVTDSVKPLKDTFQMKVDGFAGQLIPQTVNVYLTGWTAFRYGYTGIRTIRGGDQVRVVGVLIKNPVDGDTILLGRYVDALD
jgi:hypothetical protein